MNKRVVITGMGIIAPNGIGLDAFKAAIKKGKSGIQYISELHDLNFGCNVGGIPNITNTSHVNLLENYKLNEADLAIRYSVLAGVEAWLDSGFEITDSFSNFTNDEYGSIVGTCFAGTEIFARKIIPFVQSGNVRRLGSQIVEQWMPSGSAAALSSIFALSNQTTANSSACSSGTEAIILAYERIKANKAKLMLAGGTDPYTPYSWAGFDSMRLLCRTYNDSPEKASRPLSNSSNGFVPAAGAGIIVLEDLEHAIKRKARVYAEIAGCSINSGGQRNGGSMTFSNPRRVVECIAEALAKSKIRGEDIDLISGHLTGTKADSIEVKSWIDALGLKTQFPFINSLKSMTGHMIGAAGAAETIAAVLQLHCDFVHPSINSEDLHPEIEKLFPREKIPLSCIENARLKYIAKASFGFGDVNSCLVLKKFE